MNFDEIRRAIAEGNTSLGIELGSTRIKSVLVGPDCQPLATGEFQWENQRRDGLWTYDLADAVRGVQESYASLAARVREKYGEPLRRVGALGISGMMHGYLAFDKDGNQLSFFHTWRNTHAQEAADRLTELFQFNIPIRWSIAQMYQEVLNGSEHVARLDFLTTLAGYIHWRLSDEKVLGVGEASGMFPIDSAARDYDGEMLARFDREVAPRGYSWKLRDLLPRVLCAGDRGGVLTPAGAKLLDPTGTLEPGVPMAPPEGDAGTGMVATNAVRPGTGNVSAGTSIFAMIVLEKNLSRLYPEIDMVTTPAGDPVAMVHCNNGTSDIDAWAGVFAELLKRFGVEFSMGQLYDQLFQSSLEGDPDCGGVLVYNYLSGEPITGFSEGRPMVFRGPDHPFRLADFTRAQIYSALASLRIGMEILFREQVKIQSLVGHGGLFKAKGVAQRYLAAAMEAPIAVTDTAGEGGPYGMALLAEYMRSREEGQSLPDFLRDRAFASAGVSVIEAREEEIRGFAAFLAADQKGLAAEKAAVTV